MNRGLKIISGTEEVQDNALYRPQSGAPERKKKAPPGQRMLRVREAAGFVETEARARLEQACGRIGLWMLAVFEVGCTYGWRHGSLLKMRVKQIDANANVIRLEPGTTKNKKGLEVTMPRRVRELLIQCINGKRPEDYLFTRENGKPVKDFRGSWEKVCNEAGLPGLHFHDLRRTAARNMRRGHVAEKGRDEGRRLENNLRVSPIRDRG